MRLEIDSDRCTGHGRCYSLAPELFDCDDEGFGLVLVPEVGDDLRAKAQLAVDTCPERAVTLD